MDNINMIQESWFSSPIWSTVLDHDNKQLENYCNELIQQNKKDNLLGAARDGGWQSDKIYHQIFIKNESYRQLFDKIFLSCKAVFDILNSNKESIITITDSWINKSYSKSWFDRHSHSNSILSGVYYVKAPQKCGNILFHNPCDISNWWNETFFGNNKIFYRSVGYTPVEGQLIIFPSWLSHSVEKNESDSDRISIAFNASIF